MLTARQIEILTLARTGLSSQQIGEALFISSRTVEWHLRYAYKTLGARNRTGAVNQAVLRGLLPAEPAEPAVTC